MGVSYIQMHGLLVPVGALLWGQYRPVMGRRDYIKMIWLCAMATIYTTPWDNWILSFGGWSYPPGSILGRIGLVPIEEHLFFLVQSILLVLLHSITSHASLLPSGIRHHVSALPPATATGKTTVSLVQTLPRRPATATAWVALMAVGAALVHEAHELDVVPLDLGLGKHAFYLGWILIWVSPVLAFLTYLGGRMGRAEHVALGLGTAWLWMVDTLAIRAGAWSISRETTLGVELVRGLPIEEAIFFLLVSYLLVISCSLISHIHALLVLHPTLPACPPKDVLAHIALLFRVALRPPPLDARLLRGLVDAEDTLRKGSKSFQVAKLAFGREMRIGLVAVYAWCRVTDDLVDTSTGPAQQQAISISRAHLRAAYAGASNARLDSLLDDLLGPDADPSMRSAFHIFAQLVPRLCPIEPFLELCDGYETDVRFSPVPLAEALRDPGFKLEDHLPITTHDELMRYADNVAGSIAAAICYLSFSLLEISSETPALQLEWVGALHGVKARTGDESCTPTPSALGDAPSEMRGVADTIRRAREMGCALQLVNIARDIAKDALIARLYVPLSAFASARAVADILWASEATSAGSAGSAGSAITGVDYSPYTLPLLDRADALRAGSESAIAGLPRGARAGTRAMVASYFEIGSAIRRAGGQVDVRGVRVSKWRRAGAAMMAFWGGEWGW